MKILLGIVIVLAGIIVLLLAIGVFVRKDYSVAKEAIINKPKAEVFEYLKLLKNQNKFKQRQIAKTNRKDVLLGG